MVTGKSLTIKLTGKRHVGDEGNDYLAGLAWSTGADCNSQLEWTMPSGAKLKYDCVVNVVNPGSGEKPRCSSAGSGTSQPTASPRLPLRQMADFGPGH